MKISNIHKKEIVRGKKSGYSLLFDHIYGQEFGKWSLEKIN